MKLRALVLCIALPALGCAHAVRPDVVTAKPGISEALVAEVNAARNEAKALLVRQAELVWRNWTLGDPLDLTQTYVGHEKLFSKATIDAVRSLESQTNDAASRRALGYFRVYLTGEILARETASLADQVATIEAVATFNGVDGVEHPYRELERLMAGERDHSKRVALYDDALPVVDRLNPLLEQKRELTLKTLPDLGYAGELAYGGDLREADLTALTSQADAVLAQTETLYRAAMDHELRTSLGLSLADTRRADLSRFNRSVDLDAAFPSDKMLPRLRQTLQTMGIDLSQQSNIRIDDAPLPSKNPHAVCFNVQSPNDIRLSVKPVGGVTDYRSLFHEAGHAEFYANTKTPFFEFRQLGDSAPTEAAAALFEGLIENPLWLSDNTGLSGQKLSDFVRSSAVKRLYALRRNAGKLIFDFLWQAGTPDPAALYRQVFTRAYGFPVSPDDARRYLIDHDEFFSSADSIRAWALAAQIEGRLVKDCGERWWASPKAGDLLKSLWAEGNALTVDELAKRVSGQALDFAPLLAHFQKILGPAAPEKAPTPAP